MSVDLRRGTILLLVVSCVLLGVRGVQFVRRSHARALAPGQASVYVGDIGVDAPFVGEPKLERFSHHVDGQDKPLEIIDAFTESNGARLGVLYGDLGVRQGALSTWHAGGAYALLRSRFPRMAIGGAAECMLAAEKETGMLDSFNADDGERFWIFYVTRAPDAAPVDNRLISAFFLGAKRRDDAGHVARFFSEEQLALCEEMRVLIVKNGRLQPRAKP